LARPTGIDSARPLGAGPGGGQLAQDAMTRDVVAIDPWTSVAEAAG
jgi:hypothetical protein